MTREAKVIRENGKLMAEIIREEACASCRACRFGQEERLLMELPDDKDYCEGETIRLEMPDGDFSRGIILAYALPLVCMLAGLFAFSGFAGEGVQAIGALAGLGVGLLIVRLVSNKRKNHLPVPCKSAARKE